MIIVYENGECHTYTRTVTLQKCLKNVRIPIPLMSGATITDVQIPVGYFNPTTSVWAIGDYCNPNATTYTYTVKFCVDDINTVEGNYPIVITTDTIQDVVDDSSEVNVVVECKKPSITIDGLDPGECDDCEKIPAINPKFPTYSGLVEDVEDCDIPTEALDPCSSLIIDEDLCLQCVNGTITSKCASNEICDGNGNCIKRVIFNGESYPLDSGCETVKPISGTIIGVVDDCDIPEN